MISFDTKGPGAIPVGIGIGGDAERERIAVLVRGQKRAHHGSHGGIFSETEGLIFHRGRIIGPIAEIVVLLVLAVKDREGVRYRIARSGGDFDCQRVLGVAVVVADLKALGAISIFDADGRARGRSERIVLEDNPIIGAEEDLEGVGPAAAVMGDLIPLDNKPRRVATAERLVIDIARDAGIEVVP